MKLGNKILIYKTKKYGIPCDRKFEIDKNEYYYKFYFKWMYINKTDLNLWGKIPTSKVNYLFNINKSFFLMIW